MDKESKHTGVKILFVLIIIIFCFYLYGRFINPSSFKVLEIAITDNNLNNDYNGLKIVQISDLHYNRTTNEDTLKKIVNETNKLNPDLIIFTGDIFDNKNISTKDGETLIKYLSDLKAKLFKFACLGDYDLRNVTTIKSILENSNFIVLDNASKLIYYNSSTPINIIGITNTDNISELYNNDYYNITIMHKPDLIKDINNTNLAFAGHSLGGQFRIPFIGGVRKKSGANTYYEEFYQVNKAKLYISNGIGTEDISMRTFNSPSITLYRLYSN